MQKSRLMFRRFFRPCASLIVCRKTAVAARRVALRVTQTQLAFAPVALRDQIHIVTRIGLQAPRYYFFDRPTKTRIGALHIG